MNEIKIRPNTEIKWVCDMLVHLSLILGNEVLCRRYEFITRLAGATVVAGPRVSVGAAGFE